MPRSIINQLSNDLHACIDTGNAEEALLVKKQIVEARHANEITSNETAELLVDYYNNFEV